MPTLDHTKFHVKGSKRKAESPTNIDLQWWQKSGKDTAKSISAALDVMVKAQNARSKQYLISARLYGNKSVMGATGTTFNKILETRSGARERISYNVVQSAGDTIVAKTTKNRPRAYFLTSGGDYKEQRKAKKLNRFVEGLFYEQKAYKHGARAMRDGVVFGDGLTHVFRKGDRVAYERALPHEIWVDDRDAFYGNPRSLHYCKNVDREVVNQTWPGHKKEVAAAPEAKRDLNADENTTSDLITVRESWHLPSTKGAKDGRHTITIDDCVLLDEEYEKHFFPFARFTWSEQLAGFWGQGLAEQIQNIQFEINKLLTLIQRSYHLGGSFKVFLEMGSKVVKEHINNDVGSIIMYQGTEPKYVIPPLVPPEIYIHFKTLKESAYEQAGISQLSAASKKPEGLESAKALRTFNDIESERFIEVGHAYEEYFLELARLSIEVAKDIAKDKGGYSVKSSSGRFLTTIKWAEVDLEDDAYIMQIFPVSSLPSDPAGRLQTIQEYVQAGFLTPRQGKKLLDFPDMELVEGLQSAAEDYLMSILDKIIDDAVFTAPEPYDDLKLARELALEYYQRGKTQNLDEDKLDMLRTFLQQLDDLEEKVTNEALKQQQVQQMLAGQQGAPVAPPVAPSPSPLVPQAPQQAA